MANTRHYGCGTRAGYDYHLNHGTTPCDECVDANRVYNQQHQTRRRNEVDALTAEVLYALGRRRPQWGKRQRLQRRPDGWKDDKACGATNSHLFHSDNPDDIREAIAVCAGCPVVDDCLAEQQFFQAPGIWGGVRWISTGSSSGRMKVDTRFVKEYVRVVG